jgi:type IV pilus assembly protein PilV
MTSLASDRAPHICQRGMTLIEILVAIVVLSIGLLGLAGLQLKGLQVNQGSTYRWQASILAEDMADRMRADRTGAIVGKYAGNYTPAGAPSGSGSAASDWATRLAALPGGAAVIGAPVATATNGYTVAIEVDWIDTRANAGAGVASAAATGFSPGTFVLPTEF